MPRIVVIGGGVSVMSSALAYWLTRLDPAAAVTVVERDPSYACASSALSAASIRQQFSIPLNVRISQASIAFVSVAHDLEIAARSADVISCATLAEHSLLRGEWLKSHCHLDLVGSFKPTMREADDACMRAALIVVGTLAALEESGDLAQPIERGVIAGGNIVTLGGLIASGAPMPRPCRTVFKSVGVAHADLAAAGYLFERRHERE